MRRFQAWDASFLFEDGGDSMVPTWQCSQEIGMGRKKSESICDSMEGGKESRDVN
jgi:hypothetical protein